MRNIKNNQGYTLIEVIIALAVFAVLGALSVGLLSRAFDTKTRLQKQMAPITALQLAATRITEDMAEIMNRPVLNQKQQEVRAFIAKSNGIAFTRGGFMRLDPNQAESTLRRVALVCENNALLRKTWPNLDAFDSTPPQTEILLDDLTHCHFSFISKDDDKKTIPTAFRLHLDLKNQGQTTLIFMIKGSDSETA